MPRFLVAEVDVAVEVERAAAVVGRHVRTGEAFQERHEVDDIHVAVMVGVVLNRGDDGRGGPDRAGYDDVVDAEDFVIE